MDSGDDHLPVLVRLVSENGKQVKEYRIQLTKEKPVTGKTAAAVQEELPSLEVLEQELNFQTVEKEDPTLKLGESRVVPVSYTHLDVYKRQIGMFDKVCFSPNFRKNAQKYKKAS